MIQFFSFSVDSGGGGESAHSAGFGLRQTVKPEKYHSKGMSKIAFLIVVFCALLASVSSFVLPSRGFKVIEFTTITQKLK